MAILIGPCFSLEARGTLADNITYAKVGRTCYSKSYFVPTNPQSDKQTATRYMRQRLIEFWGDLTAEEQAAWNDLADYWRLSPYHAFLKFNCQRWASDLLPAKSPTTSGIVHFTTCNLWLLTLIGNTYSFSANCYGEPVVPYSLHYLASTTPGFTPEKTLTKLVCTGWHWYSSFWRNLFSWTRPDSSTYYHKFRYSLQSGSTSRYLNYGSNPW